MLTEKDKLKIRAEEIFRNEARKEIEAQANTPRFWSRVWKVLNTGFVLWLLSSVILAGVGWVYSNWQANRENERRNSERIERLDLEISARLDRVDLSEWGFETVDGSGIPTNLNARLLLPPTPANVVIRNMRTGILRSLLYELSTCVPPTEQISVKKALSGLNEIARRYPMGKPVKPDDTQSLIDYVAKLKALRWDHITKLVARLDDLKRQANAIR